MAGRGTDIKLGGNKNFNEKEKVNKTILTEKDENKIKNLGVYSLSEQKDTKVGE